MDNKLARALAGTVGYFWTSYSTSLVTMSENDRRAGSIRRNGDIVEVRLLEEDPLAALGSRDDSFPTALIAATEQTGLLLLDVVGMTRNTSIGGSRASVHEFRAQTAVAHPRILELDSAKTSTVSAVFRQNAALRWLDLEGFKQDIKLDKDQRVQSATFQLRPTDDKMISLTRSMAIRLGGQWSFRDEEGLRHVIERGLEIEIATTHPKSFRELLFPLLRCQDLLSLVFGGFVPAKDARATGTDPDIRGDLWNSVLMPEATATHAPVATYNARPQFSLNDVGGPSVFARWIRLCEKHPRAVSPIISLYRHGAPSDDVRLLQVASALEYWVAAHRRTAGWTKQGDNHAEVVARHVGRAFASWVGDASAWAERFWDVYSKLKHDPRFAPDPLEIKVLHEVAFLLLVSEILNRLGRSRKPSIAIFNDHRHLQLQRWLREQLH